MYKNQEREDRIDVFNHTICQCNNNERLKEAIQSSISSQHIVCEGTDVPAVPHRYNDPVNIIVSKKRSFEAASAYTGKKVCVLNFASATSPGGGVTRGCSAQEESLCRCSTLYPCISYPTISMEFHLKHRSLLEKGEMDSRYNDDCIYTPGVVVFKSDTRLPEMLPEEEWYTVDVITCAAPNLNPKYGSIHITDEELKKIHTRRMNLILDIASSNGAEVVILGAFGCGAFANPPDVVAAGISDAVNKHKFDFVTIEFAVFTSRRDSENYDEFLKVFEKRKVYGKIL